MICFSLVSPTSFQHIDQKWKPELAHHAAGIPFLIVGTKSDLRNDEAQVAQLKEKGKYKLFEEYAQAAEQMGAQKYCECSAKTFEGLSNVFDEAIRVALKYKAANGAAGGKAGGAAGAAKKSGGGCLIL